jgi:hypothetical protein
MPKLLSTTALGALLLTALFVSTANAGVELNDYGGRPNNNCQPVTHASYYDGANSGATLYNTDEMNGDSVYYVDTDPLAGFQPGSDDYQTTQTSDQDCKGTPVLETTAYVAVTWIGNSPNEDVHDGYPDCPRPWGDDRNPDCTDDHTGVQGAFYVRTTDGSVDEGRSGGASVP